MSNWEHLITIEQMEKATNDLLETGKKVGADSWQQRVKNQTPHCGFGESGTCCRICSMGPCRITPKAPRGICGCDVHGIVGRNYLRFTAGGAATHSDHGRSICHTLHVASPNGAYQVKDPEKLKRIAKEWGVETENKDIYDLAHEVAEMALMEYGKPFGISRWLSRAPEHTRELWHKADVEPRAIDREVSQSMHMTHMGCSSLTEALVHQSMRAGLCDGWGGSMCGTEFSDVLFGTPKPIDTEANIGVMDKDMVNIVVHGHDPSLSEMIVFFANDPEMIALAKEQGAKGIIIDLRDNLGGWVDQARYIADLFMDEGELCYLVYRDGVERHHDYVTSDGKVNTKIVILINENTASSSEILTGALKDCAGAKTVGVKSFGKGIIQGVYPVGTKGAGYQMTIAQYYTPKGSAVHKIGIEPDFEVPLPEGDNGMYSFADVEHDVQLKKAIEVMKDEINIEKFSGYIKTIDEQISRLSAKQE